MTTTARTRDTATLGRKMLNKVGCILALVGYLSLTRKDATETRRGAPLPESA